MADNPSSILLLRLQSTGSNTNLWGGYLNTAMQTLEQADKRYQTQALTGDTTITWTNYATGNIGQCARLQFTGALTANAAVTMPSNYNFLNVKNATTGGFSVTVKCSGGTGVTITNGDTAWIYCDSTDYFQAGESILPGALTLSGQIHGVVAATSGTDGVNLTQMQAAITAATSVLSGLVLTSATATTAHYLQDAVSVAGSVKKSLANQATSSESVLFTGTGIAQSLSACARP